MPNLSRSVVVLLGLVGASAMAACAVKSDGSSSSAATHEYDPLFDAPQAAGLHTDDIVGLWEASATQTFTQHLRMLFRNGQIQLANRCSGDGYETVTTGVTVQATFATGKVDITDPGGTVSQSSKGPSGKPDLVCTAKLSGPGELTYALGGGKLQIGGYALTKVTD
jgi:hypothetical protein